MKVSIQLKFLLMLLKKLLKKANDFYDHLSRPSNYFIIVYTTILEIVIIVLCFTHSYKYKQI